MNHEMETSRTGTGRHHRLKAAGACQALQHVQSVTSSRFRADARSVAASTASDSQALAALGATCSDDVATATGLHADEETVRTGAANLRRLIGAFHGGFSVAPGAANPLRHGHLPVSGRPHRDTATQISPPSLRHDAHTEGAATGHPSARTQTPAGSENPRLQQIQASASTQGHLAQFTRRA